MYGVLKNRELIAIHDEIEVVEEFVKQQKNDKLDIIKIKKKRDKILKNNPNYHDLYLVIYGDTYITYDLYETMKDVDMQSKIDLIKCKETLYRVLEEGDLTDKDINHISRTISILLKEIESTSSMDLDTLKEIKSMNDGYKERMNLDV